MTGRSVAMSAEALEHRIGALAATHPEYVVVGAA